MWDNFIKNYYEILHKKLLNDTVDSYDSYHSEVINLCNLNFDTSASLLPIMVGFYHMLLITEDPSLSQELLAVHNFFKSRSFFISIFEDIVEEYSYYSKRIKQRVYCASNQYDLFLKEDHLLYVWHVEDNMLATIHDVFKIKKIFLTYEEYFCMAFRHDFKYSH